MKISRVASIIGYTFVFLLGMLVASYYPLPGINISQNQRCPECLECPVGFATMEEMTFLVEELSICREAFNER